MKAFTLLLFLIFLLSKAQSRVIYGWTKFFVAAQVVHLKGTFSYEKVDMKLK